MEFEYEAYRRETQARLRGKDTSGQELLSHYEASEKDQKEKNHPREKLLLENSYGAVNLGKFKEEKFVLTVSGVMEDRQTEDREIDTVRETGAKKMKGLQGRAFTNQHDPSKSAVGLKVYPVHTAEKVVEHLEKLTETSSSRVLEEMLPFLSSREEKERIQELLEKRREQRGMDEEINQELETLYANRQHKEQEKKKLVQNLKTSLNKQLQKDKKQRKYGRYEDMIQMISSESTDLEDENENLDENSEENTEKPENV